MKKLVLLLLAIVILSGCAGSGDSEALKKENEELKSKLEQYEGTSEQKDVDVSEESNSNIKYETIDYTWHSPVSSYIDLALVYKNLGDKPASADITFLLKNENGNVVGVEETDTGIALPGKETAACTVTETEFANYEVKVTPSEYSYDNLNLVDDTSLKVETNQTGDKIIISVTNNGSKPVDLSDELILFFKDDKAVSMGLPFIGTDLINPTETAYDEVDINNKDFDEYKYYYTAYYND